MKVNEIDGVGFAIQPKLDCPHLGEAEANSIAHFLGKIKCKISELKCKDCSIKSIPMMLRRIIFSIFSTRKKNRLRICRAHSKKLKPKFSKIRK